MVTVKSHKRLGKVVRQHLRKSEKPKARKFVARLLSDPPHGGHTKISAARMAIARAGSKKMKSYHIAGNKNFSTSHNYDGYYIKKTIKGAINRRVRGGKSAYRSLEAPYKRLKA